ncbi:group III truncated hemoglobin [Crocinitomix sp.]|nr:group III truncated hemoglobin [Crocinitomix sp.]
MKQIISTRKEVVQMVDLFYDSVRKDELIGPVFNGIIGDNWDSHLIRMYQFWETILFGVGSYKGNPFEKHVNLPIESHHFERWLQLFESTINTHFEGEYADQALSRANTISKVFQAKMGILP